ncbi:glycerophosphodiester phosphodiesterase [Streptomyces sp. BI20]|uniref:glycerophosphodiester phosphodiesterase n=1 Tax=Streptomyces sp. BI20 TaxID=3403460 RepID=UPI003C774BFC
MNAFTVVGHRGDPYRVRENTLGSIRSAFARGADAVEIDVRTTRDGVPVLLHDDTLARLWGHEVRVDAVSSSDLVELCQDGVPTLRAALAAAGAGRVWIDLPGADGPTVRRIVDQVRENGARDRVAYCGGADAMVAVRAADPGAEIALTWTSLNPPRRPLIDAVSPRFLNYRFGLLTPELVAALHADGLLVSAWTADTKRSIRALAAAGVDSITTNRPDVAVAVRDRDPKD